MPGWRQSAPTAPATPSTTSLTGSWPSSYAGTRTCSGTVEVSGADEVKQNWDAIKAAERASADGVPGSALDGVPFGQPALALAAQLQRRAERAGVPAELIAAAPAPGDEAASGPGDEAASGAG